MAAGGWQVAAPKAQAAASRAKADGKGIDSERKRTDGRQEARAARHRRPQPEDAVRRLRLEEAILVRDAAKAEARGAVPARATAGEVDEVAHHASLVPRALGVVRSVVAVVRATRGAGGSDVVAADGSRRPRAALVVAARAAARMRAARGAVGAGDSRERAPGVDEELEGSGRRAEAQLGRVIAADVEHAHSPGRHRAPKS
eukprot:4700833-Prymnesium_polylepis.1